MNQFIMDHLTTSTTPALATGNNDTSAFVIDSPFNGLSLEYLKGGETNIVVTLWSIGDDGTAYELRKADAPTTVFSVFGTLTAGAAITVPLMIGGLGAPGFLYGRLWKARVNITGTPNGSTRITLEHMTSI